MPASDAGAILARDTDASAERCQIDTWRRLSTIEIARLVAGATRAARTLALAGLRARYPQASPRELTIRLAVITLGPALARRVYPELEHLHA